MSSQTAPSNEPGGDDAANQVKLRVMYTVNGNSRPDHTLNLLSMKTTVGQLKSRIQAELLEHPHPDEQRIIYQGRPLLQDEITVKDALRLEEPVGPLPYTLHLVIRPRQAAPHFRPAQINQPVPQLIPHMNPQPIPQPLHPGPTHNGPIPDPMETMQRFWAMGQAQMAHQQEQWRQMAAAVQPAVNQNMQQVPPMPNNFTTTIYVNGQPLHQPQFQPPHHLAPGVAPFQRPSSAPGHQPNRPVPVSGPHPVAPPMPDTGTMPSIGPTPLLHQQARTHFPHPFTSFSSSSPTPPSQTEPTVWLASSPSGPQALLFAPGHGLFSPQTRHRHRSSRPANTARINPPNAPNVPPAQLALQQPAAAGQAGQRPREQAQNRGEDDFFALVIRRGWMFLRLYMFMFLVSEPGTWRRYGLMALALIFCLLPRENPLNAAFGMVRRHIDNLIGPPHPQPPAQNQNRTQAGQPAGPPAPGQAQPQPANPAGPQTNNPQAATTTGAQPNQPATTPHQRTRGGALTTTPQEAAQRLLREQEQRNANGFRNAIRRIEQALVLFIGSLIPGVGERHVAVHEEARRQAAAAAAAARVAEEEEERRRRETQEAAPVVAE